MKSLRQFLREEWIEYRHGDSHRLLHQAKIGPHNVNINIVGKKGHYDVDFNVDSKHIKPKFDTTQNPHSVRIFKHVKNVVDQFVRNHKPTSVFAGGNTDKKDELYAKGLEKLATRYGGKYDKMNSSAKFNWKK